MAIGEVTVRCLIGDLSNKVSPARLYKSRVTKSRRPS